MKTKRRVDFSFGTKLRIIISIALIVPSLIGILSLNAIMRNMAIADLNNDSELILNQIAFQLDSVLLNRLVSSVVFLAGDESVKSADFSIARYVDGPQFPQKPISEVEKRIQKTFSNFIQSNSNIAFVFMGLENGSYIEMPVFESSDAYDPTTRQWYKDTYNSVGDVLISDPYRTSVTHKLVIGVTKWIETYAHINGVVGITVEIDEIINQLAITKLEYNGQLVVINNNGKIVYNSINPESVLMDAKTSTYSYLENIQKTSNEFVATSIENINFLRQSVESPNSHWIIIAYYPKADILLTVHRFISGITLSMIGLFLFVLLVTHLMMTTITQPILDLVCFVEYADRENIPLNKSLKKDLKRGDEIGLITRVLFSVILNLREMLGLSTDALEELIERGQNDESVLALMDTGTSKLLNQAIMKSRDQISEIVLNESLLIESRKALKQSERRFRMAVRISNDAFWDYYIEQDVLYVNKRMHELTGVKEELLHRGLNGISTLFILEDEERFKEGLSHIMEGRLNGIEGEYRIKHLDEISSYRWVMVKVKLLSLTKAGNPSWIMGVFIDIHERKSLEKRLFDENAHLAVMIEERTQELLALNEELVGLNQTMTKTNVNLNVEIQERKFAEKELGKTNLELQEALNTIKNTTDQLIQSEKLSSLGILISGVAHEVNTPLGISVTLTTFLQQLQSEISHKIGAEGFNEGLWAEYKDEFDEALKLLQVNIERAAHLIQSFKNITVDQYSEDLRSFNVCEYTDEIVTSLKPALKKTRIKVNLDCPTNLHMLSYPGAYSQIITNFIMNSLIHGYGGKSGVEGQIRIEIQEFEEGIRVIYSDDGDGISPESAGKIFDPFFTTSRGKGNTGLGLYLVHALVSQQFGGQIVYLPNEPKGVVFTVILKESS